MMSAFAPKIFTVTNYLYNI